MKISQIFSMLILIFVAGISFTFAQNDSKKDKSKDKKEAKSIEIKTNLLVQNSDGKFADDINQEDVKIYEDGVEQKINYFVKKQNAFNVGLVVDNTGSMRTQLEIIVSAGKAFVSSIRPQDKVFITRFVGNDKIEMVQNLTADTNRLNSALSNLYVEGGASAVIDGLYFAAGESLKQEEAEKSTRNALILISDGEDRDSIHNQNQLFELLKGSETQIFTIGLVGQFYDSKSKSESKNFINQLSFETGGASFFVNSKREELIAALKGILTELSSQYVVGYTSTNQKRNNERKLTVQIADGANGEKRQPTIRAGFVVPKGK